MRDEEIRGLQAEFGYRIENVRQLGLWRAILDTPIRDQIFAGEGPTAWEALFRAVTSMIWKAEGKAMADRATGAWMRQARHREELHRVPPNLERIEKSMR
jgi:hypothetical protein